MPWEVSLLAPLAEGDLGRALRAFCRQCGNDTNLRDLRFYADHGRAFHAPDAPDALPPTTRMKVRDMLARAPPRAGDAYGNCLRAALLTPGVRYCEGVYADSEFRFARHHAWLEVEGRTVDPTYQVALPEALRPGAAYFGVAMAPALALDVMVGEGRLRPVALGPPRERFQVEVEDGYVN